MAVSDRWSDLVDISRHHYPPFAEHIFKIVPVNESLNMPDNSLTKPQQVRFACCVHGGQLEVWKKNISGCNSLLGTNWWFLLMMIMLTVGITLANEQSHLLPPALELRCARFMACPSLLQMFLNEASTWTQCLCWDFRLPNRDDHRFGLMPLSPHAISGKDVSGTNGFKWYGLIRWNRVGNKLWRPICWITGVNRCFKWNEQW